MVTIFKVSYDLFKQAAQYSTVYYHVNPQNDGYILGTGNRDIVYHTRIRDQADINNFANLLEPTAIEVTEEEDALAYPTVQQVWTRQSQYDIGDTEIYVGNAAQNLATSSVGWTITRFTLVNGLVVDKKITIQDSAVWDNRLAEIYY